MSPEFQEQKSVLLSCFLCQDPADYLCHVLHFFFFFKVSIAASETGPGVKNCPWRATQFPDPRMFFAK